MNRTARKLGPTSAPIHVFVEHAPNWPESLSSDQNYLADGELQQIVECNTNHWRKIFNIAAKLCFELNSTEHANWQALRDSELFQMDSTMCMHLSASPTDIAELTREKIGIITGKTFAEALGYFQYTSELANGFYKVHQQPIWITPYFDYRQLSNAKLTELANLLKPL